MDIGAEFVFQTIKVYAYIDKQILTWEAKDYDQRLTQKLMMSMLS